MKDMEFGFERLETYTLAREYALALYRFVRGMPREDRMVLGIQLQRAAISVASNLAEGCSRLSAKDQAHFSQIAYASLMETVCQLDMALELDLLHADDVSAARDRARTLARKISALHQSQKKSPGARA